MVERELGRGGMGIVYAARDSYGDEFALKISGFGAGGESARKQLLREGNTCIDVSKKVPNPVVSKVHKVAEDVVKGTPVVYLVSELIRGPSLEQVIEQHGPLGEQLAIDVWIKVSEGLDAIHEAGVMHLDLAPGNVMLGGDFQGSVADLMEAGEFEAKVAAATPKIVDFGISRGRDQPDDPRGGGQPALHVARAVRRAQADLRRRHLHVGRDLLSHHHRASRVLRRAARRHAPTQGGPPPLRRPRRPGARQPPRVGDPQVPPQGPRTTATEARPSWPATCA